MMKHILALIIFFVLIVIVPVTAAEMDATNTSPAYTNIEHEEQYGSLCSGFISNIGQYDPEVEYVLQYQGTTVFFTRDGLVFTHTSGSGRNISKDVIQQSFSGASEETKLIAKGQRSGGVYYYVSNDSSQWIKDIPVYSEIIYEDLYSGIDLAYSEKNGKLKREFRISPGGDPSQIKLRYEGESEPYVDEEKVLRFVSPAGEMLENPLVCWQVIDGEKVIRDAEYIINKGLVCIEVTEYNLGYELIIDPELVYSSYLGGESSEEVFALAEDGSGGVWIAGQTYSLDFPVKNAFQSNIIGTRDIFVSHFSSSGSLLSSTYMGGANEDYGGVLAYDGEGGVWVTGGTSSSDFPVKNGYQKTLQGYSDAFITHISSSGILQSSTYLGGKGGESAYALADDDAGGIWIKGYTWSADFPTMNAYRDYYSGGTDIFISHFSSSGTLLSSTYSGKEVGAGQSGYNTIMSDGFGGVWITGSTGSTDFPVMKAYQSISGGGGDAFVSHLSSSGALLFSTYLGGEDGEAGWALANDGSGGIWVTGWTSSSDFPVVSASQSVNGADQDAFVSHFSSLGILLSSTYLGGGESDCGSALMDDGTGGIWVTGVTRSTNFPVTNAYQNNCGGMADAFVTHFSSSGSLLSSTYLGGESWEEECGLAGDGSGGVWVMGSTYSTDFPSLNAYQSNYGGDRDAFVTHIMSSGIPFSSTYLGGGGGESARSLAGDGTGGVWIAGRTSSPDFPILSAYQSSYGGISDAFIAKFSDSSVPTHQTRSISVPYIHQVYDTPTGFNGEVASSETSAVMVLASLGRLTPDPVNCENKWIYGGEDMSLNPPRVSVYGKYVSDEYTYEDTTFSGSFTDTTQLGRTATGKGTWGWIENAVNTGTERSEAIVDYLELHDCDAEFIESPSSDEAFAIIKESIDNNQPVIARTYLGGTTGHYAVIVGYKKDGDEISYYVNDPYGIEPYDLTTLVQHLDQPVEYSYDDMKLGDVSRGLITVHPFLRIQLKNIVEKQKTTLQYDKINSNTFADPLALSSSIEQIITEEEGGKAGSNYICLNFEASDYIENPVVIINDNDTSTPSLSIPSSNLKVVQTGDNNVVIYWDGKNGENTVNQANNPYKISVEATDKSGNSVTSEEEVRVWVGRPVLLVHGLNSDDGDVVGGLLYKELNKEYHVELIEYNYLTYHWLLKYTNGLGNINCYAYFLDSEIARIKLETGAKKVDIVAHSMGGLISRWRIQKIPSGDNDVGKLIMMGTPNHGAVISQVMKLDSITWFNSQYAINQMNPGNDFLKELNGGNSHWYDVVNYNLGSGKEDQIGENTQYYVLAGNYWITPKDMPLNIAIKFYTDDEWKEIKPLKGDGVVPYYSAMIANSKAITEPMHYNHMEMWNKQDYYDKVIKLLNIPDNKLPINSDNLWDGSYYLEERSQSADFYLMDSDGRNSSVMSLFTTIDATVVPGSTHYSELTVNNDTDSIACTAFWESGTMEIALTDPEGVLRVHESGEIFAQINVTSPQSGVWNLSFTPVSIPVTGANMSAQIFVTHPLYLSLADDTSTYPPGSSVPISVYAGTIDTPAIGRTVVCTIDSPDGKTETFSLYDDGMHDDEDSDDGIYGNTFTGTADIGVYFVNISANVPYNSEEIKRNLKTSITINSYPDLKFSPEELSISNTTPDAGDIVTFSVTVENIGDVDAVNASVLILDLIDNAPDIITESVFDIDAGESLTVDAKWKAEPGIHNITAQISPFAEFMESDYSNNNVSAVVKTNQYESQLIVDNLTFKSSETTEIPICITNQTDPGYYRVTFLYNDTIIAPSDVISEDLNIEILKDESGEFEFNGSVKEGKNGFLNIGNIIIDRIGEGGKGTNITVIIDSYDSGGKPRGLFMENRFVYLSPIYPSANFTADLLSGDTPLSVQFTDLSTGDEITGRYWSFGDGTFSNDTNPVHTYMKNGTFDVSLTVVNAAGPNVAIKSKYITVYASSVIPNAAFTADATSGHVPLTVQFTDTSTGDPTLWSWNFGDGNTSTNQHPIYTYITPGNYTVNLTVSNGENSDTISKPNYITVKNIKGDFNGNGIVDVGDVSKVAYMLVKKVPTDPDADFNGNSIIDIGDAAKIAHFFVGKVTEL